MKIASIVGSVAPVLASLLFTGGLLVSQAVPPAAAAVDIRLPGLSIEVGDQERRIDRGGYYGGRYYPQGTYICCFREGRFHRYAYHGSHGRDHWRDWHERDWRDRNEGRDRR